MDYKVVVTSDAEEDFDRFIQYLLLEKKNEQAARNVLDDFEDTYGNYSPDWAVVCRKDALKDPSIGIYFIVETKVGKTWADLTDVEKNKIHCGELHFQAVSDHTKFDWVNSYEDFINKFGVADTSREII